MLFLKKIIATFIWNIEFDKTGSVLSKVASDGFYFEFTHLYWEDNFNK